MLNHFFSLYRQKKRGKSLVTYLFFLSLLYPTKLKKEKIMKALNFLAAFVGGAAVGAAFGILFAPEKGTDTREKIAEALRKRGIKLNRKEMDTLVDEIAEELKSGDED